MAKDNKMLMLGIAGGAAVAIYLVTQKQNQAAGAAAIATGQGIPTPAPGILDIILGSTPAIVKKLMDQGSALDAKAKAMGPKAYAAWKDAVKSSATHFAVEVAPGKAQCLTTATLAPAPGKCGSTQMTASLLEGYF